MDSLEPYNDLHGSSDDNTGVIPEYGDRCETDVSDQQCEKNYQNAENVTDKYFVAAGLHPSDHQILHNEKSFSPSNSLLSLSQTPTSSTSSPSPLSSSSSSQLSPCAKIDPDDSDSGVSDLSLDPTFNKNNTTFSTLNYIPTGQALSKQNIAKKIKSQRKFIDKPKTRKSILKFQENYYKECLYCLKHFLLIMFAFFLILILLILSHVECFNDVCAISLETQFNYQRYSNPI